MPLEPPRCTGLAQGDVAFDGLGDRASARLIDVADVLGTPACPGLAAVLAKKCTLEDSIHQRGETNTYVLPSGHIKANPHHVVQSLNLDDLLNSLRAQFPYIVMDMPPILGASEALVLCNAGGSGHFDQLRWDDDQLERRHQCRGNVRQGR